MCCMLDCSQKMWIALKSGTRIWVFCSHQCPEPRYEAPVPLGLLQTGPWHTASCRGAQDPQHRWRDLLSAPGRPSSDGAKWWASATSQGMLEAQDKSGHQQYWIHTTLLIGFLQEVEPSFALLTQPHSWSLTVTGWRVTASSQAINSTLHCTLRSSGEPASSISCIRIGSHTGPAEKDLSCRSSVSMDSDHFLLCFCFLLNTYQIFDTSIEIWKKKKGIFISI